MGKAVSGTWGVFGASVCVRMCVRACRSAAPDISFAPSHPQENYELYSVELGSGPGGDKTAKMSKKKAGGGGGKKKEKLENMKKEMEMVSMGAGAWQDRGGDRELGSGQGGAVTARQ